MFTKLAAQIFIATTLVSPSLAQTASLARRPTILIHGNYCGPGNNAPLAPIDALDTACAHHDACTPDVGLPSKACNDHLRIAAERLANDPRQPPDLRMASGFVASAAAMMPFTDEHELVRHVSSRAVSR